MTVFFPDRYPDLKTGSRTIVSDLLAISVANRHITTFRSGDMIIGPLAAKGESAYVRCKGRIYRCDVDELIEHSRRAVSPEHN